MVYIGIDIAKFKHFASVVSSDGEVIVKPFPFENSRQGFMKLLEEIENFQDCLIKHCICNSIAGLSSPILCLANSFNCIALSCL